MKDASKHDARKFVGAPGGRALPLQLSPNAFGATEGLTAILLNFALCKSRFSLDIEAVTFS